MRASARILGGTLAALLCVAVLAVQAAAVADHRGTLTISFLPAGQGSATYLTAPSGVSLLIGGGSDASVVRALSARAPWWKRSIEVVVAPSFAADSSTGLVDVLQRYRVAHILRPPAMGSDTASRALEAAIHASGASTTIALRGQIIDLGEGVFAEVLSPTSDSPDLSASDGCIVLRVVYGSTAFVLPCDASADIQNYLAYLDGATLHADVLAVPGGGASAKALAPLFVGYVSPVYAVFSHDCAKTPAPAVNDLLTKFGVHAVDVCTSGTVTFVSNGVTVAQE